MAPLPFMTLSYGRRFADPGPILDDTEPRIVDKHPLEAKRPKEQKRRWYKGGT